ncbi:VWA domain-containing protein [Streptomyces sp. ISL-11]|uniref:vWA domain-containing protein n=1 Tax=Streptomyces sp. ISL-11 TaxID=2819174 RepID=UPI001BEB95F6|nr:VWA domain-containing protein [Streptomyces sp. ISL-11]MBT2384611.1 VWA domain-containing protein [Streptomyces sp. ISL-11]
MTEIDAIVEVRCRSTESVGRATNAMNLCLVVDRSGSMTGKKLDTVKRSCGDIHRRITGEDLFTVVVFDDDAQVVINPQTPRDQVEEQLAAITPGGMTNLSLGWYQGLLELQTHMEDHHYSRLILLSDGMANDGETKKTTLAGVASTARDEGITTSTIGVGNDFQEDLLEAIATASGGKFWYIDESGIENIIEEEFQGALTVALDSPTVELSLPRGVTMSRELNSLRKVSRRYRLRPLKGQDTFNFAVRLEIDPTRMNAGELTLGATLYDSGRRVAGTERNVALAPLADVTRAPVHPLVRSVVEQFEAATTDERAVKALDDDDLSGMRKMLTAEVARFRAVEQRLSAESDGPDGDRYDGEMGHLAWHRSTNEVSAAIVDLVQPYPAEPAVRILLLRLRKGVVHKWGMKNAGQYGSSSSDDDVQLGLLVEAIGLADVLIAKFPDDRAALASKREKLREYLARFAQ